MSLSKVKEMLKDFYPFAKERFGFDRSVNIKYLSNPQNSADPLGKTAFYESENDTVNVYVDNRHPKDILRSISHELVHHTQNCRGQLSNISTAGEQGYAQNDLHLREMERQAYELGNMCFRDWEDGYKMSRGDHMNIQEMVRSILRSLQEQKIIEVTTGDTAFEEVEAAASAWKAAMHDKQVEEAFLEAIEKHVEPELEQMGLQDESALSLSTAKLQWFSKDASQGWSVEVKSLSKANNDKPGWLIRIHREGGTMDGGEIRETVGSIREALELVRTTVQPNKKGQARPGEDPNQMELPLKEQGEPFPVGARVTHKAKTTLGAGTVVEPGRGVKLKSQERRIEWKENFRKAQTTTTTENIMMLQDASVKENINMSKDILEEGFDQRLRDMVGEQIKVALENALLSEDNVDEQTATSANPEVRDELERAKTRGDPQDKYGDQIDCSRIQSQEEYDACHQLENLKKEQDDEVEENISLTEQDDERKALKAAIEAATNTWKAMESMTGMPGVGFDAAAEAKRASKMVDELEAKLAALGEGLTLEEKVKAAVRGALAPAPLSLEEKIKNAVRGALLQEEEDKKDDDKKDDDKKDDDKDDDELESTDKHDSDPALVGDQDELPDEIQDAIIDKKEDEEVNEGSDMAQTRFGKSLVPGKQVAVNMSGKPGDPEVMATVESEPDWSTGNVEVKIAEGDEAGIVKVVSTDNVWEPETNEGKRVYNRDEEEEEEEEEEFIYAIDPETAQAQGPRTKGASPPRGMPSGRGKNEGLSRLAEAGKRELDLRNNRLFESLKKKWAK